ncbi:hypothetical protein B0I31_102347 [Saccharothrix carnea]|uniref:Uncharacterized protein n=1 Tax=Saccharothrix carnea TaxID=1280637 RepID=A0A2P8IFW9_SACCR|nr:hypothetical protein B0I31_102347 [Saccharothrix carnea]
MVRCCALRPLSRHGAVTTASGDSTATGAWERSTTGSLRLCARLPDPGPWGSRRRLPNGHIGFKVVTRPLTGLPVRNGALNAQGWRVRQPQRHSSKCPLRPCGRSRRVDLLGDQGTLASGPGPSGRRRRHGARRATADGTRAGLHRCADKTPRTTVGPALDDRSLGRALGARHRAPRERPRLRGRRVVGGRADRARLSTRRWWRRRIRARPPRRWRHRDHSVDPRHRAEAPTGAQPVPHRLRRVADPCPGHVGRPGSTTAAIVNVVVGGAVAMVATVSVGVTYRRREPHS